MSATAIAVTRRKRTKQERFAEAADPLVRKVLRYMDEIALLAAFEPTPKQRARLFALLQDKYKSVETAFKRDDITAEPLFPTI